MKVLPYWKPWILTTRTYGTFSFSTLHFILRLGQLVLGRFGHIFFGHTGAKFWKLYCNQCLNVTCSTFKHVLLLLFKAETESILLQIMKDNKSRQALLTFLLTGQHAFVNNSVWVLLFFCKRVLWYFVFCGYFTVFLIVHTAPQKTTLGCWKPAGSNWLQLRLCVFWWFDIVQCVFMVCGGVSWLCICEHTLIMCVCLCVGSWFTWLFILVIAQLQAMERK